MNMYMFIHSFITGLCFVHIESTLLSFNSGYTLQGAVVIRTFTKVSFEECRDLCRSRKKCLSFELDRPCGLCRLSSSDRSSDGVQMAIRPRTVYSEKALWSQKYIDPQCSVCSMSETCFVMQGGSTTCEISECENPDVLDPMSSVLGNKRTFGANILHTCNDVIGISSTSICGEDGKWSEQQFVCPANLEGKKFKIFVKENNKFWHFDGGHPSLKGVTTIWQPNDKFVQFMFEKQGDGSYKIKSVAQPVYMYDGFGVTGAHAPVLNGNDNTDDDHMRYYVSMVTPDYYTIKTKASGRYVRVDEDQYVTSKYNLLDDRSFFNLVEV